MVIGSAGDVDASGNERGSRTRTGRVGTIRGRGGTTIALSEAKREALICTSAPTIHLYLVSRVSDSGVFWMTASVVLGSFLMALTAAAGGRATAAVSPLTTSLWPREVRQTRASRHT